MKRLILLLASVFSFLFSFGCCARFHSTDSPNPDLVQHLKSSVVTVVYQLDNGAYIPMCGGVWIDKSTILTARHCITNDDDEIDMENIITFQIYKEFENQYPFSKNEKTYLAKITYVGNDSLDLAVLTTLDDVEHDIATIANYNPADGMSVHIIGHPRGLQWGYMEGHVSATRIIAFDDSNKRQLINIVGFVWMGNSGGGAFDSDGNLLGIASAILTNAPGQALFVHTEQVRKFLKKHKVKYHTN